MAHEFCSNPELPVTEVERTKLVDFENIALRFQVNIRLYEPVNQSAWRLVFGEAPDSSISSSISSSMANLPNVDIGLYEWHCFYIKDLDVLANHWECQQRFTHHDNYDRHIAKNRCMGSQPKLFCLGEKFKKIMNASMARIRSFLGMLAGGSSASPSLVVGTFITHCATMEGKGVWSLTKTKFWLVDSILGQ